VEVDVLKEMKKPWKEFGCIIDITARIVGVHLKYYVRGKKNDEEKRS